MSEKAIDCVELPEGIIRSLNVTYELNRDAQFVYDKKISLKHNINIFN